MLTGEGVGMALAHDLRRCSVPSLSTATHSTEGTFLGISELCFTKDCNLHGIHQALGAFIFLCVIPPKFVFTM